VSAIDTLHVVFKVGTGEYVLPARTVLEMESFTSVTPVPGTDEHVAGLVQIRGRVIPLVDLRARFGLPRGEPSLDQRVVVIDHGGRRIGLLADSARDVARIDEASFEDPPDLVAERASGFVRAVARVGSRLVMLLDCERVLGQEHADG
jgi:purine-binding chemotaxis protein CheW